MKYNDIFNKVLQVICEECEVSNIEVLSGRNRDAVDAKCLLVSELSLLGVSDENIGGYLSMTRQGVNKLKNAFRHKTRASFYLQSTAQRVSNRVATELRGVQLECS